jgi:hypothetical protein
MSTTFALNSLPKKICFGVWLLGIAALLLPFAISGESWGTVWIYAAVPLSFITEEVIGIGRDSYVLIGAVSAGAAALWVLGAYTVAWLFVLAKRKPNQASEPTTGAVTPPADAGDRASSRRGSP